MKVNRTEGEKLIMAGMVVMVEREGKTPHEALDKVDEIKDELFFALYDIKKRRTNK